MIPVNKPFLPSKEEFDTYVRGIWDRVWLTNHGPLVKQFESEAAEYLKVARMLFVNNGTTALQLAIKALGIDGEIITTPYSYAATTHSILWQNCKPVFADIDEISFNIDASKIESAITGQTSAILATHVYGNPCNVEAIDKIAQKYGIKVIYDAAHCFGVTYKDRSVFEWGDISITSFHATKVFHTVEGGGIFTGDDSVFEKLKYLMNFGHDGPYRFKEPGINAKNTEFHAAMGLCNLKYADECLQKRRKLADYYDNKIQNLSLSRPKVRDHTFYNYAYYPVLFETPEIRKKIVQKLKAHSIETRSYFRPSLQNLPYVDSAEVPVSSSVAQRVLCLPLFYDLTFEEIDQITEILQHELG